MFGPNSPAGEWIREYVRYWSTEDRKKQSTKICEVCEYALKMMDGALVRPGEILNEADEFLVYTPFSNLGVTMSAYWFAKLNDIDKDEAIRTLSPRSIFRHFKLQTCSVSHPKEGAEDIDEMMEKCGFFTRHNYLHKSGNVITGYGVNPYKELSEEDEDCDTDDQAATVSPGLFLGHIDPDDEPQVKQPPCPKKKKKKTVTEGEFYYKEMCRFMTTMHKLGASGMLACCGTTPMAREGPCIYADNGSVGISLQNSALPMDTRRLLSIEFFKKHMAMHMTYEQFIDRKDTHDAGQMGFHLVSDNNYRDAILMDTVTTQRKEAVAREIKKQTADSIKKIQEADNPAQGLKRKHTPPTIGRSRLLRQMPIVSFASMMPKSLLYRTRNPLGAAPVKKPTPTIGVSVSITSKFDPATAGMDTNQVIQYSIYKGIRERAQKIIDIHAICNDRKNYPDNCDYAAVCDMNEKCIWCDLIMDYGVRVAIHDLVKMCRNVVRNVKIERSKSNRLPTSTKKMTAQDLRNREQNLKKSDEARANEAKEKMMLEALNKRAMGTPTHSYTKGPKGNKRIKKRKLMKGEVFVNAGLDDEDLDLEVTCESDDEEEDLFNQFGKGLSKHMTYKDVLHVFMEGQNAFPEDVIRKTIKAAATDTVTNAESYSYDFHNTKVDHTAFKQLLNMWCREKFPFMNDIMNYIARSRGGVTSEVSNDIVKELYDHITSTKNILCTANTRSMSYETDANQVVNHSCFLPILMHMVTVMGRVNKNNPLTQAKAQLRDLALKHGIGFAFINQ